MTDKAEHEKDENLMETHTHKWSLQKDADFAAESARLLQYFVAAQHNIPCVHQDHPSVQAVETMVRGMMRGHSALPGLAESVEIFAHIFFAAGQQYAIDGHVSSAHKNYEPEDDLSGPDESQDEWNKAHQELTVKWRNHIRKQFYGPRKNKGLAELLSHLVEEHGDTLDLLSEEMSERDVLRLLLGRQRTAPETEQDDPRAAGPYL